MTATVRARIVTAVALGICFAPVFSAQLGHVVDAQKISDTSGGFTALLDEGDQFGRSIVNLGDMDGDGVSDLLVGAHTDDDGGTDKGAVYILFMRPNGFVKSWSKISDTSGNFSGRLDPNDQFGRAACSVGDLNLDGVVDVVVSSNYDDDGGTNRGAVYVLFLNADGTVKSSQKISQTQGGLPITLKAHDEFGRSITNLGDLDGDGIPDIVVGTPEDDDGGTNTGALHVLFLNRNGTVKAYRRISRSTDGLRLKPGDWFGHSTANLGDFNHDGVTDLVVGAVLDDDGGVNQGSVWILYLNANGSVKEAHEINELLGGFNVPLDDIDQFGTSVANIGDLDGDGVTDIVVGAVKDDDGGLPGNADADVGAVYVLFLNADATVKSSVKISDTTGDLPYDLDQYDWFGSAVARLGGSSGDGFFNLAIGCRNDDDGSPNLGAVYLVQLNDGTAPAAEFTADKTLGVAPMTVHFSDLSTGGVTAWVWNFNDGPQSSLQSPTKTFGAPGTYDVQLTARGPKGRDSETKHAYVTVVTGPLADFGATPTQGLAPLDVQFTDLSEGLVTSWAWDFGDGASSTLQSPQHTFGAGLHTVTLTVTGPTGTNAKTRTSYIDSQDLVPSAEFSLAPATGFAPLAVQFTDESTGMIQSWSWNFGDGTSSTQANPAHTYATPGIYTVALTVGGPFGTDTRTQTGAVVVTSPVPQAQFSSARTGLAPQQIQFDDLSTGNITSWSWNFGDGGTSNEAAPAYVYTYSGTYAVSLTVAGPNGSDTETKSAWITIDEPPPVAEFDAPSALGFAPFTVQFTDQSSGTVTLRSWSFGDGSTGGAANPTHTYPVPGVYTVSLTVSGPYGSDSEVKTDLVRVLDPTPIASFSAAPRDGFAPLPVQFTDTSAGNVTSWSWDFGDGSTSSERDPAHNYARGGSYNVQLLVSGPLGTDSHLETGYVTVQEPPVVADFAVLPSTGVAPLTVEFNDLSTGWVTSWSWDLGDGASATGPAPTHTYTTPGSYSVTLTASGPLDSDVLTKTGLITVQWPAPVAEFTAAPVFGFAPLPVAFTDLSTGNITSWTWAFGDGATSRQRFPVKTYTRVGNFTVTLTVKGPGGTRSMSHGGISVIALPTLVDGGFELDTIGTLPRAPWTRVLGTNIRVQPSSTPDAGFPREGTRWCEIGAEGSNAALPPTQPGGVGVPPSGAAGIEQTFAFAPLAPHLVFDAAFLLDGPQDSGLANDFMSVDVGDGTSWVNLYYADSFSEFPSDSTLSGLPMTAITRVHVDLRSLFPGILSGASLILRVGVGNGGDDLRPSKGYVDAFRLVPAASATVRNGLGRNALRYASTAAVLGGAWTVTVDTTGHANANLIQILGTSRPATGTIRPPGELLTSGKKLFGQSFPAVPGVNVITLSLPPDLSLMGQFMATQVTIGGGLAELTNAVDLVLGF